jgi:hypothetical protein
MEILQGRQVVYVYTMSHPYLLSLKMADTQYKMLTGFCYLHLFIYLLE